MMRRFSCHGSMSTASKGGEEVAGSAAVAAAARDYCTAIAAEASSSFPTGSIGRLAAMEEGGEGARPGRRGDEEYEAELELGLSLGAKKPTASRSVVRSGASAGGGGGPWGEYCRILTAKDFPSIVACRGSPISSSSSTASSSPSLGGSGGAGMERLGVGVNGTKRVADSAAPEVGSHAPRMFLSTVKRLRIMRTSDATGLGPRCQSFNIGGLRKNHM